MLLHLLLACACAKEYETGYTYTGGAPPACAPASRERCINNTLLLLPAKPQP
jgi:hypothetical protein